MSAPRILVVDDCRSIRLRIERTLAQANYSVLTAENGRQALGVLASANRPDLIILDVVMPEMDGYDVCEQLNDFCDADSPRPPIVFLTSVDSNAMELLGKQYGVYLQKPVDEEELLMAVKFQLESAATDRQTAGGKA